MYVIECKHRKSKEPVNYWVIRKVSTVCAYLSRILETVTLRMCSDFLYQFRSHRRHFVKFVLCFCLPPSQSPLCLYVIECKHRKSKEPVNYCIYVQYYCHPTLHFGCNRKYYIVFLFCSFQFNASEIVIDYTRDTEIKWFTGRRRLKVVELFTK